MDRESDVKPSGLAEQAGRRFRGSFRDPLEGSRINPYVREHRAFGEEIVPASDAPGLGGRAAEVFGRVAPLHLEVGSGNGFYLSGMAERHPEVDWVGIEVRFKRVVLCARKLRAAGLANARVVRWDAFLIEELFPPGTLAGIHVNHPDPWAKEKSAKRRLIGPAFLDAAARLLAPGGELRLKTDFAPHVDALVDALPGRPFALRARVDDVARDGAPWPDEVVTNYQRKAGARGVPVLAAWLTRLP